MELEVRYRGEGELTAEVGPLFLRLVDGAETTAASVDRLIAQLDAMLERWPIVGILVAVEHGSPQPAPDVRKLVDRELRRYGARIVIAYAFLGIGFWNSAAREFGHERAATIGAPVLVAASVRELAQHVARELIGTDPELIERCFEQLRAELRAARR